jgi:hypothetical protein
MNIGNQQQVNISSIVGEPANSSFRNSYSSDNRNQILNALGGGGGGQNQHLRRLSVQPDEEIKQGEAMLQYENMGGQPRHHGVFPSEMAQSKMIIG